MGNFQIYYDKLRRVCCLVGEKMLASPTGISRKSGRKGPVPTPIYQKREKSADFWDFNGSRQQNLRKAARYPSEIATNKFLLFVNVLF